MCYGNSEMGATDNLNVPTAVPKTSPRQIMN